MSNPQPINTAAPGLIVQVAPTPNMPQQFQQLQFVHQGQQMLPYQTLYLQQSNNIGQQMGQQIQLLQQPTSANQQFHILQNPGHQFANGQFGAGQFGSGQFSLVQQPQLILMPPNQFVGSTPQTPHVFCNTPGPSSMLPTLLLMPPNAVKQQQQPPSNDTQKNNQKSAADKENQNEVTLPNPESVRDFASAAVASTPMEEATKLMKTISLDNSYSYLNYNPEMEALLENTLYVTCGSSSVKKPGQDYGCKLRPPNDQFKQNRLDVGQSSIADASSDSSATYAHDVNLHDVWMSLDEERMPYKPILVDRSSDESIGSEDEEESTSTTVGFHSNIQEDESRYSTSKTNETDDMSTVDNSCDVTETEEQSVGNLYPRGIKQGSGSNSSGQKDSAFETTSDSSDGKNAYSPITSSKSDQISVESGPPIGTYQSFQKTNLAKASKKVSKTATTKNKMSSSLQPPRDLKRKSVSPTFTTQGANVHQPIRKTMSPATRNFRASGRPSSSLRTGVKVTLPLRKAGNKMSESARQSNKGWCASTDCRTSTKGDGHHHHKSKRLEDERQS